MEFQSDKSGSGITRRIFQYNKDMTLQDIPAHLGRSAAALARELGMQPQSLNSYLNGARGKRSKFLEKLLRAAKLQSEEVIFRNVIASPKGEDREHAAYWLNVALEALREAEARGADVHNIAAKIHEHAWTLLPEVWDKIE